MANIEFTFRCPDCVPVYPSGLEEKVIFGSSTGMEVVITGTNTRSCERERGREREPRTREEGRLDMKTEALLEEGGAKGALL